MLDSHLKYVSRGARDYFWRRQGLHFLLGALIGGGTLLLKSILLPIFVFIGLFGVITTKEILEYKSGQGRFKTIVDMLAWYIGFWAVAWPGAL